MRSTARRTTGEARENADSEHAPTEPPGTSDTPSTRSTARIPRLLRANRLPDPREPEDSSFDWFKTYDDVADIVRELIPDKSSRILMLGCGNSTLSKDVSAIACIF